MKSRLVFIAKALVSLVLLVIIVMKIEWKQLIESIRQGDLLFLALALIFGAIFNAIKFFKWHKLISTGNHTYAFLDGVKSYMIGNALGMVTPMRAGDLGRALYFPSNDRPRIIGLTIIDRLIDLSIVFLLALAGSFILISKGFGILVGLSAIFIVQILYSPYVINRIIKRVFPKGKLKDKLINIVHFSEILNYKIITLSLALTCIAFIAIIIEFYFLVFAFENISLQPVFLIAPLITLSTIIPITVMGFGVREGISILLLSIYGISSETALSAAFMFFLINNFTISIFGAIFLSSIDIKTRT